MSSLKSIRLPASANLKLLLVVLAFAIVAGTLWFTQQLVNDLRQAERKTIELYGKTLQELINDENADPSSTPALNLAVDLVTTIEFPMMLTDAEKKPSIQTLPDGRSEVVGKYLDYDTTATPEQQLKQAEELVKEMEETYDPIIVYTFIPRDTVIRVPAPPSLATDTTSDSMPAPPAAPFITKTIQLRDSIISNYIFYDDSKALQQLSMLPYVELTIVAMFILVGYIGFSHVKRNEQSNIWVGMAKETAHQLGTPLSSLMGWTELLRYMPDDPQQVLEAAGEMERDIERLNRVAHRFSKIGSAAELKPVKLNEVLANIMAYFERRLPNIGRKVTISLDAPEPVYAAINVELFEWVLENLVRNAADAIDRPEGTIHFHLRRVRDLAVIDVQDNGRGIDPKIRKDIFRPGFSTKQRGWGLGLSLARRIVEEYHKGKIAIKDSSPAGTTFRIRLKATEG
ncbi:MAG: HAMP domain-containing histidine kinase [Armatimonadetes bacterium]|nr:HAMP domain-containing histidine kinase [Armatimonadota bacterium]